MIRTIVLITVVFMLINRQASAGDRPEDVIRNILKNETEGIEKNLTKKKGIKNPNEDQSAEKKITREESPQVPSPEELLLKTGIQHYNSSLFAAALNKFEELRKNYPNSPFKDSAAIWSGRIKLQQNNVDDAIKAFKSINEKSGEYPTALYMLGEAWMKKGCNIEAIESLYRFSSQFPEHELADDALIQLSKLYLSAGKGDLALESTLKVIKYYSESNTIDNAYYMIGKIYEKDPNLKDIEISRRIYRVFLTKARNGDKRFLNSPLKNRVEKDLGYIERTYFKMEK